MHLKTRFFFRSFLFCVASLPGRRLSSAKSIRFPSGSPSDVLLKGAISTPLMTTKRWDAITSAVSNTLSLKTKSWAATPWDVFPIS